VGGVDGSGGFSAHSPWHSDKFRCWSKKNVTHKDDTRGIPGGFAHPAIGGFVLPKVLLFNTATGRCVSSSGLQILFVFRILDFLQHLEKFVSHLKEEFSKTFLQEISHFKAEVSSVFSVFERYRHKFEHVIGFEISDQLSNDMNDVILLFCYGWFLFLIAKGCSLSVFVSFALCSFFGADMYRTLINTQRQSESIESFCPFAIERSASFSLAHANFHVEWFCFFPPGVHAVHLCVRVPVGLNVSVFGVSVRLSVCVRFCAGVRMCLVGSVIKRCHLLRESPSKILKTS
jgi:hypothetical protein